MAIAGGFGIDLYDFRADGNLDLFNGIENERAQAAVEAVKLDYVVETDAGGGENVVAILGVVLERISVCPEAIITDIEKVGSSFGFIIENEATPFQTRHLLGKCEWSFGVFGFTFVGHIKLEDLPGCAVLREAWEVISAAKLRLCDETTKYFGKKLMPSSSFLTFERYNTPEMLMAAVVWTGNFSQPM